MDATFLAVIILVVTTMTTQVRTLNIVCKLNYKELILPVIISVLI